jgi:hypothetical protein
MRDFFRCSDVTQRDRPLAVGEHRGLHFVRHAELAQKFVRVSPAATQLMRTGASSKANGPIMA